MFCLQVILLFVATVFMTACFHSYAHLPPVLGMMTGLGMLKVYGWWRGRALDKRSEEGASERSLDELGALGLRARVARVGGDRACVGVAVTGRIEGRD